MMIGSRKHNGSRIKEEIKCKKGFDEAICRVYAKSKQNNAAGGVKKPRL
jgi:hypothetical protein